MAFGGTICHVKLTEHKESGYKNIFVWFNIFLSQTRLTSHTAHHLSGLTYFRVIPDSPLTPQIGTIWTVLVNLGTWRAKFVTEQQEHILRYKF